MKKRYASELLGLAVAGLHHDLPGTAVADARFKCRGLMQQHLQSPRESALVRTSFVEADAVDQAVNVQDSHQFHFYAA